MATNHVGGEGEAAAELDLPEMVEYSTKITGSGTQMLLCLNPSSVTYPVTLGK